MRPRPPPHTRRTLPFLACSTSIELWPEASHLRRNPATLCEGVKADDGARTRDLRLGKPRKYLLSASFRRICGSEMVPVGACFAELGTRVEQDVTANHRMAFGSSGRRLDAPQYIRGHVGGRATSRSCRARAARASLQAPNRPVTTLAAAHLPSASRSSASPPRRRACVRDQSYEDGSEPYRARHSRASMTSCRVQIGWIAPWWHALQYAYASPFPLRGCV